MSTWSSRVPTASPQLIAEGRLGLHALQPERHQRRECQPGRARSTVIGNRITVDFGVQGIGGNRNSATGNGYYRLAARCRRQRQLRDGHATSIACWGIPTATATVNATDQNNVNANFGRRGTLNADVNGDGVVNSTDRNLVNTQFGRKIASTLVLHD